MSNKVAYEVEERLEISNSYLAIQYATQVDKLNFLSSAQKKTIYEINKKYDFDPDTFQSTETIKRYADIAETLSQCVITKENRPETLTTKIDKILLHKVGGYAVFLGILFLIFQSVFSLAQYPMDFIDQNFTSLNNFIKSVLPEGLLSNLITDGLLAGIGGVVVFVPQIALLFAFISLLEESG
ncbi:MAG: hypothetical protein U5M53_03925 [Rhodoferax sp.]|nr:hypothetical protein [Rhodoferax sp.]